MVQIWRSAGKYLPLNLDLSENRRCFLFVRLFVFPICIKEEGMRFIDF